MLARLVVVSGPDKGRDFSLVEGQTTIGRSQATDTGLGDPYVSRTHCQVEVRDGKIRLSDMGSASGTLVNGQRVSEIELKPGDVVRIGNTELRLQIGHGHDDSTMVGGELPTRKPSPSATASLEDLIGEKLAHFAIERELATGSSGMVFLAHDLQKDRRVAMKVLWPESTRNEEAVQRFIRAMQTMMPIRHPNIVSLHAAGKSGPYCWLAMEYIDGESLTEVIGRIGSVGMLDWRYAFRVAVQVGRALEAVCRHEIVHRNIKPTNILIHATDQVVKLGDLMLAKAMAGSFAREITQEGQLIGDVAYMSPERASGRTEVDGRADIYSLGATVYAVLTGHPPFEGGSLHEVVAKIREAEPVKPKKYQLSIPDLFEGVVLRMLSKRPEDRHQSPTELLSDLARVGKYQGIEV